MAKSRRVRMTPRVAARASQKAATLIRMALAEVGVYQMVAPMGEWAPALQELATALSPEDGWVLVRAAELLAENPDPGFWARLTAGVSPRQTG